MNRSPEVTGLAGLEQFRDPKYPQLYWVFDPKFSAEVLARYAQGSTPFGLEIGCGERPVQGFRINPEMDWLHLEPDIEDCTTAKHRFDGLPSAEDSSVGKMLVLTTVSTRSSIRSAQILFYRNPEPNLRSCRWVLDGNDIRFPSIRDLQPGQRLILVMEGYRTNELNDLVDDLQLMGFEPSFRRFNESQYHSEFEAHVNMLHPEFVFDFTK